MDATCAIQASIHVFSLVRKYVSRILGTYQIHNGFYRAFKVSRQRESNPPPQLGKLIYYRCTMSAKHILLL